MNNVYQKPEFEIINIEEDLIITSGGVEGSISGNTSGTNDGEMTFPKDSIQP